MVHIKYSIIEKNRGVVKRPKFYGRIREKGREKLVPIGHNREDAERWLRTVTRTYEDILDLERMGKPVPGELSAKLVTVDTPAFARNDPSKPVSAPGGMLEAWEKDMRLRAMRESTIGHYTRAAAILVGNRNVMALGPDDVVGMIGKSGLKPNTRRYYRNVLRSLLTFAGREDLAKKLPKIKYEQVDRPFWNEEQMSDIIHFVSTDDPARTLEYKDYFSVMASIGSRQGETYALRWKDILEDGCIRFRAETTKSRKERIVPIPFDLWASLEVRRGMPEGKVFPLVSPSQSRRYRVLRRALDKLGLEGGLHTFRHSVSMILYKKTTDIKAVSQLLGHSPQVALEYYQNSRSVDELRKTLFDE